MFDLTVVCQWQGSKGRLGCYASALLLSAIEVALLAFCPGATLAQIAGDGTLGTQVNGNLTAPCTGTCIITNGTTRGSNLFHSFQQFSLPNGDFAGFVTAPTIQNVIVRVTGMGQPFISNINGTIATVNAAVDTINPANFFLLNPNGIVFGRNARVLIGSSFLATTANRMQFADGTEFRINDPAPLLTVSVPIGLQFNATPGNIQMQRTRLLAGNRNSFGDFALVGGDVTLDNSIVRSSGQRVELAGVSENGTVGLRLNGDRLSLNLPANTPRRDITLINGSTVNAIADNGGNEVVVTGRNISLDESYIYADTLADGNHASTNQAGDITIDASAHLQLTQGSSILNRLAPNATGQGGNTSIAATDIRVRDGSVIGAITYGNGNAGNVRVIANTILLDGTEPDGFVVSGIVSGVFRTGHGRGGDITVQADSLTVTNGAVVSASTNGNGDAGNIQVNANTIVLDGITPRGFSSSIGSAVAAKGSGRGGDVTVQAGSLTVTNGAGITASLLGNGRGGNVVVQAGSLTVSNGARVDANTDGTGDAGSVTLTVNGAATFDGSGAFSQVNEDARGNGGSVELTAGTLSVTNGAKLRASTFGEGNAGSVKLTVTGAASFDGLSGAFSQVNDGATGNGGNVELKAGTLTVTNGAELATSTFGIGNAGNVKLMVTGVASFDGFNLDTHSVSGAFSQVIEGATGKGGGVELTASTLSVTNGAALTASTSGTGDAGSVKLRVTGTATFDGATPDGGAHSGAFSQVFQGAMGKGGNVELTAGSLTIANDAQLSASTASTGSAGNISVEANRFEATSGGKLLTATSSSGQAGDITVKVNDRITLAGANTGLFASTDPGSTGNGGNIFIDPRVLTLRDGALIAVNSQGTGQGGNITIEAGRLTLDNQGKISAETASNQGGSITLTLSDLLLLRHNSQISTTAGTTQSGGDGGNITINAPFVLGVLSENSDITANAFTGRGGNVSITTNGIYGLQFQKVDTPFSDITASSRFGVSGTVTLNTLNIDPSRGLAALPLNLVDPSRQIADTCSPNSSAARGESRFTVTGRGGLPASPDEVQTRYPELDDLGQTGAIAPVSDAPNSSTAAQAAPSMVEAQGWVTDRTGKMFLVTQSPQVVPHSAVLPAVNCRP